ncbi:glutathione S-transferase family protein [Sagittula sp. S175]|uniref:glutathione S-transferase family protein n=1 Tax=Sagittula sp. S175 TaxID=3415129 RepID=UPI003C7E8AFA
MIHLYGSAGSCSVGTRILLEEAGADYTAHTLDFAKKEQFSPEFRAVNPKGKVPAVVRPDGSLLTEYQAIAFWIADTFPQAGLLPNDAEARLRVMELMDYMVASVHMRGFTFVIVPMKFSPNAQTQADLVEHGRAQIAIGFEQLAERLEGHGWLAGEYSVADSVLFYMTRWALLKEVPLPPAIAAHHNRMLDRPAVQRAIAGQGITVPRA